jgi:diguanylate cyclase (GGDEF)-like protein
MVTMHPASARVTSNSGIAVSVSLGVALFPQDDVDPETLLRHADQAMYQAKQGGKSIYRFFEPDWP